LLGNILESVKRLDESRSKAALPGTPAANAPFAAHARAVDGAAKLQEERAAESRRLFEQDAEAVMRRAELASTPPRTPHARARKHVLESSDEDVYFDFAPAERPWRDLLCVRWGALEAAAHSPQARGGHVARAVHGDDRVARRRPFRDREKGAPTPTRPGCAAEARPQKPQAGVLSKHELKALARSVPSAPKRSKYDAPPPPEAVDVVVTLNQKKVRCSGWLGPVRRLMLSLQRDLRSIEEVQEEMRKKTQKGEAGGAEAAPPATG